MIEFNAKRKTMKIIEILFGLSYLFTVFIAAMVLYTTAEAGSLRRQYALMSFILGIGDAFHLTPRIYAMTDRNDHNYTVALGIGKLIASITMTLFYIFLWEIGKSYYTFHANRYLSMFVYGAALLRILLCILPQNRWLDESPPLTWGIIRNTPFFILGMTVMLFYRTQTLKNEGIFSFLWFAIMISFVCYLPVVLFSKKIPKWECLCFLKAVPMLP